MVKNILERIKKVHIDKGYSQDYMADRLGISQNAYHKLKRGHIRIHLEKFVDIAKILEIEISELINGPDYVHMFFNYYEQNLQKKL